ncbi:MAG: MFS transporter [Methanosarcinaceae archaeon]|nr:MFS transporter [Methanosarcinaceae archaeon]
MGKNDLFSGISRNVVLLGMVSLFTDMSSQMVFPLLPLYLTCVLGAGAYVVGIVEGAAQASASMFKLVSGYWSDRLGRRKVFVIVGYTLSAVTKPLLAFANVWTTVLFVRVVERVGKGVRTAPRDAIVAESTDQRYRGRAYGFHRSMDGFGSIIGALLAYILLQSLDYRDIFLLALIPGMLAVFFLLFVREEDQPVVERTSSMAGSFRDLPPGLHLFILVASVFSMGHFGYAFLLLKAVDVGLPDQGALLMYVIFYMVYTLCTVPAGIVSDRIGRRPILMTGYLLFALVAGLSVMVSSPTGVLGVFVLYGVFFALIDGSQRAFVVDLAPPHLKATALGAFHASIGLVALPGGMIAGMLWDTFGPGMTFMYGSVLAVAALLMFTFVKD